LVLSGNIQGQSLAAAAAAAAAAICSVVFPTITAN
jgi:hypothetical protein